MCRTTHSVAYDYYGSQLYHKLSRPKGNYINVAGTGGEVGRYLKLKLEGVSQALLGNLVKDTVARYEQSSDDALSARHVPKTDCEAVVKQLQIPLSEITSLVLIGAKALWKGRISTNSNILATHDTYLKLFQLSKPQLGFDVIYLDEAADTTPCVLNIVLSQSTSKIILVGDARQSIYAWRGAVNAMQSVKGYELPLSHSFRYGQAVADVAMNVLENTIEVVGSPSVHSVVGRGVIDKSKPYTRLFRTNAYLLSEAVYAIDRGEGVDVQIDTRDFIKVLESSLALYKDDTKNVKHERILPYATWKDLCTEANEDGGELFHLSKICGQGRAAKMIATLTNYTTPPNAQIIMTTCHKSKGLEYSQVQMEGDYNSHYNNKKEWVGLPESEQNLLYVGVTRAIDVLEINDTIQEAIDKFGKGMPKNDEKAEVFLICEKEPM